MPLFEQAYQAWAALCSGRELTEAARFSVSNLPQTKLRVIGR